MVADACRVAKVSERKAAVGKSIADISQHASTWSEWRWVTVTFLFLTSTTYIKASNDEAAIVLLGALLIRRAASGASDSGDQI